ncbi:NACHT domain-containing protein [Aeromonas dhakensis]|uniref:NACHT domain-containing protein n=1 Tax=Aeromonas dhakensis TaxID=196024 RepID=UPI003F7B2634
MDSTTLALSSVALKEIVSHMTKKILEKPWGFDTENGKEILNQLSEEYILNTYTDKYVSRNLKIRTLHSAEDDVYLDEIYSPLTLQAKSDFEIRVDDNISLDYSKVINIIGIAGQGKSTILRKIFLEEIRRANIFPFFIELRKLDNSSILNYFKKTLNEVGIDTSDARVEYLLQSRKALLLLDGFDEIPSKDRIKTLAEIVSLNTQFNARIIVTSRPGTEICHEPGISNLTVKNLTKDDVINIIKRLDRYNSSSELKTLLDNNKSLRETLKTPILANLLYVCYPYLDKVPENVIDFYDKLFITLYSRHDKIKNFNREKYASIPAGKANDIFNALCFESIRKDQLEFNESKLNETLYSAMMLCDCAKENSENIKQDIINITCLLQKDGYDRYVFLHRSIQEFHAAKFIASLPLNSKKKVYSKLKSNINTSDSFYGAIGFLMDIDTDDCDSELVLSYMNDIGMDKLSSDKNNIALQEITESIVNNLSANAIYKNNILDFSSVTSLDGQKAIRAMRLFSEKITSIDDFALGLDEHIFEMLDDFTQIANNERHTKKGNEIMMLVEKSLLSGGSICMGEIIKSIDDKKIYNQTSKFIFDFYNSHYKLISERVNRLRSAIDIDWNLE